MNARPDCIDADTARDELARRGLTPHDPLGNGYYEVWKNPKTGKYHSLPYCNFGNKTKFNKDWFERTLDQIDGA
jgi:hypothetical protein